jgi:glutamate formiminotransferase
MGVNLEDKGLVQVSMNLTNYQVTNIPIVYEFIKEEADKRGVEVEESEIIGLVPLTVLEGIVRHYVICPRFSIRQVIEQRILESE